MKFIALFILVLLPCASGWGNATYEFMAENVSDEIGCRNYTSLLVKGGYDINLNPREDPIVKINEWLNMSHMENISAEGNKKCYWAGVAFRHYSEYYDPSKRLGLLYRQNFEAGVDRWVSENRSRWSVSIVGVRASPELLDNITREFSWIYDQKSVFSPQNEAPAETDSSSSNFLSPSIGINDQNTSSSQQKHGLAGTFAWFGENQNMIWQYFWWIQVGLVIVWLFIWHSQMRSPEFSLAYNRTPSWGKNFVTSWGAVLKLTFWSVVISDIVLLIVFWALPAIL